MPITPDRGGGSDYTTRERTPIHTSMAPSFYSARNTTFSIFETYSSINLQNKSIFFSISSKKQANNFDIQATLTNFASTKSI